MSYVRGAAQFCANKAFWRFLESDSDHQVTNKDEAAVQLRLQCGIKSRRELETNKYAQAAYTALITRFNDFLRRERA